MSWKAWFMIITIISAATVASYYGVNVTMNIDLNTRLSMVEGLLTQPINSTFYTLQKESNYIVSVVKSGATTYYTLQNGTDGTLQWYSTNKTALHVAAAGNLTDGGTIYCKNQTWTNTITLLNTVMVIESYNGTWRTYSNQGKFILPTLAADPSTATFGTEMHIWFNSVDQKIKFWDGAAIQLLPSVGGGALNVTLPDDYTVWKSVSTFYLEDKTGNIVGTGSNACTLVNIAVAALTSGGRVRMRGDFSNWAGTIVMATGNVYLIGDGRGATTVSCSSSQNAEFVNITSSGNHVIGMTVDMNGYGTYGVRIVNQQSNVCEDLVVQESGRDCLRLDGATGERNSNKFVDCKWDDPNAGYYCTYIGANYGHSWFSRNIWCDTDWDNNNTGVYIASGVAGQNSFEDCVFWGLGVCMDINNAWKVWIHRCDFTTNTIGIVFNTASGSIQIDDCFFWRQNDFNWVNDTGGFDAYSDIVFNSSGTCMDIVISGNIFSSTSYTQHAIYCIGDKADYISVTGNCFSEYVQDVIDINGGDYWAVSGNTFRGNAAGTVVNAGTGCEVGTGGNPTTP
jgi:hypothetical protein